MRRWPFARSIEVGPARSQSRTRLGMEVLEGRWMLTGSAPTVDALVISSTAWTPAFRSFVDPAAAIGYRLPVGSATQLKPLPWTNLDQISIRFSEDVEVQAGDLSLTGVNAPTAPISHFFYDAITHVATWTLASPLLANSYHIDLAADGLDPVADLDGNALDGEWTNGSSAYPSGNGTAGGDFEFAFKVLPGDSNQSAVVDTFDYLAALTRVGANTASSNYNALVDVDGSGSINSQDVQHILGRLSTAGPTGSPLGAANDAPTTSGDWAISIDDPAIDVSILLFDAFEDSVTPDAHLTYQIVSNSSATLFDSAAINPSSGQLVLNAAAGASGRSYITVSATDAGGLKTWATFVVDVNYENVAPSLNFWIEAVYDDVFEVFGVVADDGPVEGLLVEFAGALNVRASVRADGTFSFIVTVPEEFWGDVTAAVSDLQGLSSTPVEREMSVS